MVINFILCSFHDLLAAVACAQVPLEISGEEVSVSADDVAAMKQAAKADLAATVTAAADAEKEKMSAANEAKFHAMSIDKLSEVMAAKLADASGCDSLERLVVVEAAVRKAASENDDKALLDVVDQHLTGLTALDNSSQVSTPQKPPVQRLQQSN